MKIWWVLLKSNETLRVLLKSDDDLVFFCLNLVSFAQIRWRFDTFFCSDLVSFAPIRQWSSEKYRLLPKGTSDSIFVGFDRSNRQSNISDPTWPIGFCGRRWVFSPKTQHHRVGCGLGTNLTQGHPYIKGMQSIKASSLTVIFIFWWGLIVIINWTVSPIKCLITWL